MKSVPLGNAKKRYAREVLMGKLKSISTYVLHEDL